MPIAPRPGAPLSGGGPGTPGDAARFGVLTVSDRASAGKYEDLSGPAILHFFADAVASPWEAEYAVVPDERLEIEAAIIDMVRRAARSRVRIERCRWQGPTADSGMSSLYWWWRWWRRRPGARQERWPVDHSGANRACGAHGPPLPRARRSTTAAAAWW